MRASLLIAAGVLSLAAVVNGQLGWAPLTPYVPVSTSAMHAFMYGCFDVRAWPTATPLGSGWSDASNTRDTTFRGPQAESFDTLLKTSSYDERYRQTNLLSELGSSFDGIK